MGSLGALVTASFTVLAGVFVFVAGQVVVKFFIEPIHAQRKTIGEIVDFISFHAPDLAGGLPEGGAEAKKVSDDLKRLATRLRSDTHVIPWYGFWALLRVVPSRKRVADASSALIGLSNNVVLSRGEVYVKFVEQLRTALRIHSAFR